MAVQNSPAQQLSDEQLSVIQADLIALTEDPRCNLLRRPIADLSVAEQHAMRILHLLEGLDALHFSRRDQALLDLLAATPIEECVAIADALHAIGAPTMLRALRRVHQLLRFELDRPPTRERARRIAEMQARRRRLLERVCWDLDVDEVEFALWRYLAANPGSVRGWRPSELPADTPVNWNPRVVPGDLTAVAQATYRSSVETGDLSIFVIAARVPACTHLIDAWCALRGDAVIREEAAEAPYVPRDWQKAKFSGLCYCAAPGLSIPRLPQWNRPQDRTADLILRDIATARSWALVPWPYVYESAYALVTADAGIARQFRELLERPEYRLAELTSYLNVDPFTASAGGAIFAETDQFGEAALVAAAKDGCPPWLVLQFVDWHGHWWRSNCARLKCTELRRIRSGNRPRTWAIYRADDLAAYRQLWSMVGENWGAAVATVSGRAAASQVLDCIVQIHGSAGARELMLLSQQCGWAYMHSWGGGADEHYAMFHAQDPLITHLVYQYAASRVEHGWSPGGRW